MRKYVFILKSELMSSLQYIFNILIGFIGYFIHIFIFMNLWKYIYSDPSELINGYTMNEMIWYVIITEILWSVVGGRKLCRRISNDVKNGNIAYNINKPYNYIGYALSSHLGEVLIKFIIYSLLGLSIGFIFLGSFPSLNIISILGVLLTSILAIIIDTLFITFIGLFSFIIEDSTPFYWLYSKIILIFGTLFPVELFPKILQPIIKYSPIIAVSYGPAKLFVNFTINNFIKIFLIQIFYLFIAYTICNLLYKKGVKKLNVNGG